MPSAATPSVAPAAATDTRATTALLKALADDNRLRILALLARGELCVCHIAEALALSQPNVSQHLTVLKNAGVVDYERRGSWMYHRLADEPDPARARIVAAVLEGVGDVVVGDTARLAAAKAGTPCT
jgi:ArsR family transcriptional regulator